MSFFKRSSKFHAVRTADGFPSKLESSVNQVLRLREKAGEIQDIKRQQSVPLVAGINWRLDFSFVDCVTGETIWAEAKGIETSDYKLKLKLWREFGPGALEVWKGNYTRPKLTETIVPVRSVQPVPCSRMRRQITSRNAICVCENETNGSSIDTVNAEETSATAPPLSLNKTLRAECGTRKTGALKSK